MAPGPATPGPSAGAGVVAGAWLRRAAAVIHERRTWLTDLDAAIGDGDHGINLDRGFAAVAADLDTGAIAMDDAGPLLTAAGRRLLGLVGGASGALYGRALMAAGSRVVATAGDGSGGALGLAEAALAAAIDGIAALGHAVPGDKTMLDALIPALTALRGAAPGEALESALARAADAAEAGAAATIPLVARKGRSSYLGERSAGHLDPGAASSAILVRCLADVVATSGGGVATLVAPLTPR